MRAAALACLLLLAACSGETPAPPAPSLPVVRDSWSDRECACLERGECSTPEAFEGESEDRGFQCRWEDRSAGRAVCSYESRSRPADPAAGGWTSWEKTSVPFRHGDKGWCWTARATLSDGEKARNRVLK